jgi:hypothetical protein
VARPQPPELIAAEFALTKAAGAAPTARAASSSRPCRSAKRRTATSS